MKFTKAVASGNDFVIIDNRAQGQRSNWLELAERLCARKAGVGADGLLLLEKSEKADVKMRIFNPDGGEVSMCGNGSRCVALYCGKSKTKIETKAGILEAEVLSENRVKVKMTEPKDAKLNFTLNLNGKDYKSHYIDTGVPHVVSFVEDIDSFNVNEIGRLIRYHRNFQPEGTNADFVKIRDKESIKMRTYERGVEDETLACGTGACACAIITSLVHNIPSPVDVYTMSGEVLKVYFDRNKDKFKDVYLEGETNIIYEGTIPLA